MIRRREENIMAQVQEQQAVNITINEMILMQLRDLRESQRELKTEIKDVRKELNETRKEFIARMDKQDAKIDKLDEKINGTRKELNGRIDKLSDKIDDLHKEIKSSSNHGQIATISSVGIGLSAVSITLGVLYALIFK